jgi:hypothetical protein
MSALVFFLDRAIVTKMKFSRIFPLLLLATFTAHSQPAISPSADVKAGIFSTVEMPALKTLLAATAPTAKVSETHDGAVTNFICEWPDVTVRFTIKPHWDRTTQCLGMKNWISSFPAEQKNTPDVQSLNRKIDSTVDCVGAVIAPRYDSAGKAASLILGVATKLDGYIFSQQSFYDATGAKIIGNSNAPASLSAKPIAR